MKLQVLLLFTVITATSAEGAEFLETHLEENGARLTLTRSDGSNFPAPRIEDQDGFSKPAVSANKRYAGWLAMYRNQGTSYPQPILLAVLGPESRLRRFTGDFGMIYGWCFTGDSRSVVYKYQFPHGVSPIGFEMRRLADGKLQRKIQITPIAPDANEDEVIGGSAPAWTQCAQASSIAE
ncbi:hypothetical protein BJL95_18620 [Methylomonas sp. LWB]|uniref:hypothetical protein n=1 Tax=Methylomonas sp. LWB TaxID=1905845 RepID=UPI0008D94551|nr:hypothetical protein [Methylomonas sp. LWB]OHX34552.1 hypothetical protein BJL95_18620 [Methylomonas sp. LWB]